MDLDGNLYFAYTVQNDSRPDYCCFAAFTEIRAIVQKSTMAMVVNPCESVTAPSNQGAVFTICCPIASGRVCSHCRLRVPLR